LGFAPEDRKHSGIVADLSVRENIALAPAGRVWGSVNSSSMAEQRQLAEKNWWRPLGIKTASLETPIGQLSGRQTSRKAIIARLAGDTAPRADPR